MLCNSSVQCAFAPKKLKMRRELKPRQHLACRAKDDATSAGTGLREASGGRRQALMLGVGTLGSLLVSRPKPGLALDQPKVSVTPAGEPGSTLPPEMKEIAEILKSFKGSGEDGEKTESEMNTIKQLGLVAVLGLILIPLIKLTVGGGLALTTLKYLQKDRNSRRSGKFGSLAELLGEVKDPLSEKMFEVRRCADERVSGVAALAELTSSPVAAECIRELERERKVVEGWHGLLEGLGSEERKKVVKAIETFSKDENKRRGEVDEARKLWRESLLSKDFKGLSGPLNRISLEGLTKQQIYNEVALLDTLAEELGEEQLEFLRETLQGTDLLPAPPIALGEVRETVYVLDFNGDTQASGVDALTREISVLLSLPTVPSEVVLKVTSPGGTVTGYGLCSAQLQRLTQAGVKLTVCIDQLAASGGYLMACVADQILCAPYAAVGSIGVVAQLPNVAERLEREGIDFITTTAGKWKRTVTPFKKPTEEELAKQQKDILAIYDQFSSTVEINRPGLEIEQVATGEVWYGKDALIRGLVDSLMTSSEYIMQRMDDGAAVFTLKYKPKKQGLAGALSASSLPSVLDNFLKKSPSGNPFSGSDLQQFEFLAENVTPKMEALPLEIRLQLAKALFKLD